MMRMIKATLIILVCYCGLFAQANDSVDVSALVKQQILLAQQKEKNVAEVVPLKTVISEPKLNNEIESSGISTSMLVKIIIFSASILAAAIVIGKRRYKMKKIENRIKLKQNVKQLREEQLVKRIDPRLQMIRKKLCLNSNYLNKPEKEVILAARKLSIAKEEIFLASRLKKYGIGNKVGATVQ